MRNLAGSLVLLTLLLAPAAARDAEPGRNLIENGSFEHTVPGAPPKDAGQGPWTVGGEGRMPDGWTLNAGYPGTLTLLPDDAAEGALCLRIASGAARDAQMFRACSGVRSGRWYRVSMRVRGGTAALLVYVYAGGRAPKAHALATTTAPAGQWRTVTGFYTPRDPEFTQASVALLVPKGGAAVVDDVRVEAMTGPVADPKARPIRLANREAEVVLSGAGELLSLRLKEGGRDLAATPPETPVLAALVDGVRMPVSTLTKKGHTLVARFPDAAVSAKLRVDTGDRYFRFEVVDVKPKDLEGLDLRFPVAPRKVRDTWMPGTYDDEAGITHMGITPNTQVRLGRFRRAVAPEARWWRWPGIRGGTSALIATRANHFLPTIRQMELDTGLPSPVLRSDPAGGTATADWARVSPSLLRSYLFATYLGRDDLEAIIQSAKQGGFGLIMLHRKSWRASAGHETVARTAFPDGLPSLAAACKRIHEAGLGVGLHLYGPAVSTNDAYVTPVPDQRLFSYPVGTLAAATKAGATELVLREPPSLPRLSAPDLHPGDLLRIGDEIIRWREVAPGPPARLRGCERGMFGTKAKAHRKGAPVHTLVQRNGGLLVDPDSTLPAEMGEHLARVVNACQADLVYFDGCAYAPPGWKPENWYYLNRVLLASCAKFDHGVIVQTGMGPGRQLHWHLVPRSASADGHGDLKGYLDKRLPGIRQMRRTYTAADVGWYALDVHGRPDELEYVCARTLAFDASISVQANKPLLDAHPRAREVFDMLARWERRRRAGDVPEELRTLLEEPGRDIRLLEDGDAWSLWDAAYEAERVIEDVDGDTNLWKMTNDRTSPVRLAVEIQRIRIAATPAQHAAPSALPVEAFDHAEDFVTRGDPTLSKHILVGGRAMTADGFGRRGVKTTLTSVRDETIGGPVTEIRVASTIGGAGWGAGGKTFPEPIDLTPAKSLGLWVHGDGTGTSVTVVLVDGSGSRARFPVTLDYGGWRFQSFERHGPRAFAWDDVAHLFLEMNHVPPKATVAARVAAFRAMPTIHLPTPMPSITLAVGRREIDLNIPLEAGRVITIDALGRAVYWPGGMKDGWPADVAGGPLVLEPGTSTVGIRLADASDYAGDLRVRFCRTWPLAP